jgi:hypothetical protein
MKKYVLAMLCRAGSPRGRSSPQGDAIRLREPVDHLDLDAGQGQLRGGEQSGGARPDDDDRSVLGGHATMLCD